jgi:hypothetical protein
LAADALRPRVGGEEEGPGLDAEKLAQLFRDGFGQPGALQRAVKLSPTRQRASEE